ncbi:TerC family protein [Cohnella lubricantis]|uniref:TerC family protein n=1 Tax=Cohnella lubricantis TaxID=2163172 RepID=A0A841TEP1_9BACL|nr:TerC family protein [Cohnella lubricantis]MBB6678716.1 TerC family protein [Cohnella lubricantis]MBP2119785.1 YjbE family integral membrane protein [Cohnella lubricantis]
MDILSLDFLAALLTIIFIDLLLAGDNAIVIGLAARNLPKEHQKKAIWLGMGGAVLIRVVATLLVVYLLKIPFLLAIGGVVLLWIAYKLLVQEEHHDDIQGGSSLWGAVRTIVIADAAMGLDNVIAVAGAAHGSVLLVVLGLLISIPVIVWGSTIFVKLIGRFPWIIYLGSAVLAYTAAKMVTHEPQLEGLFHDHQALSWTFIVLMIIAVLVGGWRTSVSKARKRKSKNSAAPKPATEQE